MAKKPAFTFALSASRLATFQKCSWLYETKYVRRMPDETNVGALQGTACHTIFECLLVPKRKKLYNTIIKSPATITNSPAVTRYVRSYMKKYGLPEESFDKIDAMVIVGLLEDFFCKGGEIKKGEYEFRLESEKPRYKITGKIDTIAHYQNKWSRIKDYKSSKKKYEGKDKESNVQAMMYALASKHLWPELIPIVDFMFLQFPDDPIIRVKPNDAEIRGFEYFLEDIYEQMENFDEAAAKANLAAKQGYPSDGSFSGRTACGRAKYPGELKKDGTPMWHCPMKFGFTYWKLCDADGNVIKSSKQNDLKADASKGQFIVKSTYKGCPAHKQTK